MLQVRFTHSCFTYLSLNHHSAMTSIIKTTYPIQNQYADRLGGVLLSNMMPSGTNISISGHTYRVYFSIPVTLTLFVSSGIVTVTWGDCKLYGTARIKRFANLLGIWNQTSFINSFFQNAQIVDTKAVQVLYFCSFTGENVFISWNQS